MSTRSGNFDLAQQDMIAIGLWFECSRLMDCWNEVLEVNHDDSPPP
jgi:hypothetical protein